MSTAVVEEPTLIRKGAKNLACKLTDEEVLHYGEQLAGIVEDIGTEESRASDVKAQLKARMTELESRRSLIASKVRRREEYREVAIRYELQDDGLVHVIREDTDEQIEVRPPHDSELQHDLPINEESAEDEDGEEE